MKKRKVLSLLLLAVFLVSTGWLIWNFLQLRHAETAYDQALALAVSAGEEKTPQTLPTEDATLPEKTEPEPLWVPETVTDDPYAEELATLALSALEQVNPQVLGWIRIPDSRIDYPILQGDDNDFYLNHSWQGVKSHVGSIFLEMHSSADMTDFNTIVYGHNMADGSMFAGLHRYKHPGYREDHPYVYLLTGDGVLRYEVFSTYTARVEDITYGLRFPEDADKEAFLNHALQHSEIDTGIVPEITDRILTLSTCSGAGYTTRRVVHARLKMVHHLPE